MFAKLCSRILRQDKPKVTPAQKAEAVVRALGLFLVVFGIICVILVFANRLIMIVGRDSSVALFILILAMFGAVLALLSRM